MGWNGFGVSMHPSRRTAVVGPFGETKTDVVIVLVARRTVERQNKLCRYCFSVQGRERPVAADEARLQYFSAPKGGSNAAMRHNGMASPRRSVFSMKSPCLSLERGYAVPKLPAELPRFVSKSH